MKRYDLSQPHQIRQFVSECEHVIQKHPFSIRQLPEFVIEMLIKTDNVPSIFRTYSMSYELWESKYCLMLSKKTIATFEYYNSLTDKQLKKELRQ